MSVQEKLSPEDFVLRAIEKLIPPGKKGFIPSWGTKERLSFNELFARMYPGVDSKELTQRMAKEGKIVILPMKAQNGRPYVIICPAGTETLEQRTARYAAKAAEREATRDERTAEALKQMGLE